VFIFRTSCSKTIPNVNHHGRKNGIMKKIQNDVENSKNEMPTPTRVSISK
jgi:hypothetical protein